MIAVIVIIAATFGMANRKSIFRIGPFSINRSCGDVLLSKFKTDSSLGLMSYFTLTHWNIYRFKESLLEDGLSGNKTVYSPQI